MLRKVFDPFSGCEILPAGSVDEVLNDAAKTMVQISRHYLKQVKKSIFKKL